MSYSFCLYIFVLFSFLPSSGQSAPLQVVIHQNLVLNHSISFRIKLATSVCRSCLPLARNSNETTNQPPSPEDNMLQRGSLKGSGQLKRNRLASLLGRISLAFSFRLIHLHIFLKSKHLPQRKLPTATNTHRLYYIVLQRLGDSFWPFNGLHHENFLPKRH